MKRGMSVGWVLLGLLGAIAVNAAPLETVRGKVTRVSPTGLDVSSGDRTLHLSKDPFSRAGRTQVKEGDEVVVTYELKKSERLDVVEIRKLPSRQEAGKVPPPGESRPKTPEEEENETIPPQKDDRIFYPS